ncbi:MAG: hypothetical protein WAO98_04005 [Alphaproteobacteria bacterium]
MNTYLSKRGRSKSRGFTLTEISLGIGISALVIAAVWGAVSRFYENMRTNQAERNITVLAQALELMSTNLDTTLSQDTIIGNGYYYAGAVNQVLVDSGAVPQDMLSPTKAIVNPWKDQINGYDNAVILTVGTYVASAGFSIPAGATGAFGAPIPPAGSPVNTFEILYNGIPYESCIKLATFLTGPSRSRNIVTVFLNNWSAGSGIQTFPIPASLARTRCTGPNSMAGPGGYLDGTSSINIVYKYR